MRALVQRVSSAQVTIQDGSTGTFDGIIEGEPERSIGLGYAILLGVGESDTQEQAEKLWSRIKRLRIFADEQGKTNLSIDQVGGQVLIVSQFTLYADCKKGNRPSFVHAAGPEQARELYRSFVKLAIDDMGSAAVGEFGADMVVDIRNEGPFTIWLDTDTL